MKGSRFLMFLLVGASQLGADPAGATPTVGKTRFEHLTGADGLSQMTVFAILQDRLGFMWFGTWKGLNRYDGHEFKVFKHDPLDPGSLSSDWIEVLHEDRSGILWIGTGRGGLNRFDPVAERFTHFRHDPEDPHSLSHDHVFSIAEGQDGALWLATNGGLDRFDPVAERFTHYRHDPEDSGSLIHDQTLGVLEDRSGNLWVGTLAGLDRFDATTERFIHYRHDPEDPATLGHEIAGFVLEDRTGRLWVATLGGLDRFDRSAERFIHYRHDPRDPRSLSHDEVIFIREDRAGNLWVGTRDGGLNHFDPATEEFTRYRHDPEDPASLSHDFVACIYEDRSGILWIGTGRGGASRFDPAREYFRHYRHDPRDRASLSHDNVYAFREDRSGALWIGTWGGGLDRFDPVTERFTHYRHDPEDPQSLSRDHIWALEQDRSGALWIGTWGGGLDRFDPLTERFTHYRHDPEDPASLSTDEVTALHQGSSGALWIGTWEGGLNRFDPATESFTRFQHDPRDPASVTPDVIYALHQDRAGALWLATWAHGLDRFDPATELFSHYRHDPGDPSSLNNNAVASIHEDRSGALWIGTDGALNRFDHGAETFTRFGQTFLAGNAVVAILEDDLGRLWLSTLEGLVRFDPKIGKWTRYDTSDGVQGDEFNRGSGLRSADGTFYFGGYRGINAFRPERFRDHPDPPPIVVTSFKLFEREAELGRSVPYLERLELDYRSNFFSFGFAALSFTRHDKNRYAYMLEGFDGDWINAGSRPYAPYTNVPPGHYVFRAKASSDDGVWNETTMKIVISPPWWKTWWAYAVYSLGILLATAGYLRFQSRELERERAASGRLREIDRLREGLLRERTSQLAERERLLAERERLIEELRSRNTELERFNYTVSHDLKNPLVTIKNFLGVLEKNATVGDMESLKQDIRRIDAAAETMRRLIEELLELSRVGLKANPPEEVPFGELAREAVALLAGLIDQLGVEVSIAPDLPDVLGDRIRLLELILNLVENAVKFMGGEKAPRVEVGLRAQGPEQVFYVRDNGIGIDPAYHKKIFGLFERLDQDTDGTGIGLALVKRIVEVHGGRIWVESEGQGRGSIFCFTLPAGGAEAGHGTAASSHASTVPLG